MCYQTQHYPSKKGWRVKEIFSDLLFTFKKLFSLDRWSFDDDEFVLEWKKKSRTCRCYFSYLGIGKIMQTANVIGLKISFSSTFTHTEFKFYLFGWGFIITQ